VVADTGGLKCYFTEAVHTWH